MTPLFLKRKLLLLCNNLIFRVKNTQIYLVMSKNCCNFAVEFKFARTFLNYQ